MLAFGVVALSARDASGAVLRAFGLEAARDALSMPIGAARDARLDDAQSLLTEALSTHADDSEIWGSLAQTRYVQATGAQVRTVSPALVAASLAAARRAEALAPDDAAAQARLAAALSLVRGRQMESADALNRSYDITPLSAELAQMRMETADRVWSLLDQRAQTAALAEACIARRTGAQLGPSFAAISANPTCASQGRNSSPTSP